MTALPGFLDRFYPATCAIEFVRVGLDDAIACLTDWTEGVRKTYPDWSESFEPLRIAPISEHLQHLLPIYRPTASRVLITETRSEWLALMGNGVLGIGGVYPSKTLAQHFGCEMLSFVCVSEPAIPSYQFSWDHGDKFRWVAAHKESRWEWHENGDPLPFEETESYLARKKRDRLTPERLGRYAQAFGIALEDADFYSGNASLYHLHTHQNHAALCRDFGAEAYAQGLKDWHGR